jgi:hypothetical protein
MNGTFVRAEEQVTVEISGDQAQDDGDEAGPPPDRLARERQQCGKPADAQQERHGVADFEPLREVERLHARNEHLEPRPIETLVDVGKPGAIGEAAVIPGERFGAGCIEQKFIGGDAVVADRRQPDHEHGGEQRQGGGELAVEKVGWPGERHGN